MTDYDNNFNLVNHRVIGEIIIKRISIIANLCSELSLSALMVEH
jgi:hypothetical protein